MSGNKPKTKYWLRLLLWMLAALAILTLTFYICMNLSANSRAKQLLAAEEYLQAQEIYEKLGNRKMAEHCEILYTEKRYNLARIALQTGKHSEARPVFEELGDYKDSRNLLDACDYLYVNELIGRGKYTEARKICLALGDYPGVGQALESCNEGIYSCALQLAMDGKYADASESWRELGEYRDSATMVFRCERMLEWLGGEQRHIDAGKLFPNGYYENVYKTENAYIVVPENCDRSCGFLLYYPGGTNEELNTDFLNYYLMNPVPDSIAVFLRRNGLKDMQSKNSQALEIMEQAAAECGVFVHDIVVVGSSMGSYPAMHSVRYSMQELGIRVQCVLSLDAGADWDTVQTLRRNECIETAAVGAEFYLFESPWVGLNRPAIKLMVESGIDVTMVGCYFDEHVRITNDAMGMGVLHWALGDRTKPCELNIYTFTKLYNE